MLRKRQGSCGRGRVSPIRALSHLLRANQRVCRSGGGDGDTRGGREQVRTLCIKLERFCEFGTLIKMWNDEQVHDETNRYLQALEEDMGIGVQYDQFSSSDSDDELTGKLAKIRDDMMRRLRSLEDISSPPPVPPSLHSYHE